MRQSLGDSIPTSIEFILRGLYDQSTFPMITAGPSDPAPETAIFNKVPKSSQIKPCNYGIRDICERPGKESPHNRRKADDSCNSFRAGRSDVWARSPSLKS